MNNKEVTLVITSCGRLDLLENTITSFFKFNTYPIAECIIVEDSGFVKSLDFLIPLIPVQYKFIINNENKGQLSSIDLAYSIVKTPYIFHCEDDWEFYKEGFIETSFKILEVDPSVITVWLRNHNDTMKHPIEKDINVRKNISYYYMETNYKHWHGFTLNPGLRRTDDIMKIYPYSKLAPVVRKKKTLMMGEADLSIYYYNLGYRGAITTESNGFVKHTGDHAHIPLPWEK